MAALLHYSGLAFGLVGWLATMHLIRSTVGFCPAQRRALLVSGCIVWMIAAFGSLVQRGTLNADAATAIGGTLCMLVGVAALARELRQGRSPAQ